MINGNWEQVKDLSDIIRIINENIGYEFAHKVEEIFEDYEYIGEIETYINKRISEFIRSIWQS